MRSTMVWEWKERRQPSEESWTKTPRVAQRRAYSTVTDRSRSDS